MQLSDFDFDLPENLIALRPVAKRDFSRLLYVNPQNCEIKDYIFKDLPSLLKKGDCLVFNNSKTIAAQLNAIRPARDINSNDIEININLHKKKSDNQWYAFLRPAKRIKCGDTLIFQDNLRAIIIEKLENGEVLLEFNKANDELLKAIDAIGKMPIPPYIGLKRAVDKKDNEDYQTIYSEKKGSVATPTAGLHFTNEIMEQLQNMGVQCYFLTLHVGAGTFLPVKTEDLSKHNMHSEYFELSQNIADALNLAKREGRRIIAVGTTSLRSLESALNSDGFLDAKSQETNIFIYPPKKVKFVDALISNFHLPKSTLLMLMSAFSGIDIVKKSYKHAIENGYRFFSYGDAGFWEKQKD